MTIIEYEKVKGLSYLEYCDYLQEKYGIAICDYFTKSWNKNARISRTKEGLVAHHKYEDHGIMLSNPEYAKQNPYEWQLAKNIVYCDYLEHLLLHILICEYPSENQNEEEFVGIGGVVNFLVPELNDLYSGWITGQSWRKVCHDLIINDKDVYLLLIKRFKKFCHNTFIDFDDKYLFTSFNEQFGLWSKDKNQKIFEEISQQ